MDNNEKDRSIQLSAPLPFIPRKRSQAQSGKGLMPGLTLCSSREARELLPYERARELKTLPIGVSKVCGVRLLTVAISEGLVEGDPEQIELSRALRFSTDCEIEFLRIPQETLEPAIFRAYHGDEARLEDSVHVLRERDLPNLQIPLAIPETESEVAKLVSSLIDYALSHGASDLQLLPRWNGSVVRLRIDGEILSHEEPLCSLSMHEQIVRRVKVISKLDITNRGLPQDGTLHVPFGTRGVQVRVSIMPTVHGEKAALRFAGLGAPEPLEELGYNERTLYFLRESARELRGMILLCGATGSGKTTTLYSVMEELSTRNLQLVSIEDPVERQLHAVSQTSISSQTGLSYPICLRAVMRQDPDVILIGEIRDGESAAIAFQASMTGHLVLSSLHSSSFPEVLLRLRQLGVETLSLAQGLKLVICQKLVPKLCSRCKVIDLLGSHEWRTTVYRGVGCPGCDYSGYQGRIVLEEATRIDAELSQAIGEGRLSMAALEMHLSQSNSFSMKEGLRALIARGVVSPYSTE